MVVLGYFKFYRLILLLLIAEVTGSFSAFQPKGHPTTLHTIGNSFCYLPQSILDKCTKKPVALRANWLGGKLMKDFAGKDWSFLLAEYLANVKPGDVVMFFFGFLDCQVHVHRESEKPGMFKYITELVRGYEKVILENAALMPNTVISVAGVSPPVEYEYSTTWGEQYKAQGTVNDRLLYTMMLNERLEQMCERNKFTFVDFYEGYASANGTLIRDMSDGNIHIKVYHENTKIAIAKLLGAY